MIKQVKKISIGVVRMANIKPSIELTKYLLNNALAKGAGVDIKSHGISFKAGVINATYARGVFG